MKYKVSCPYCNFLFYIYTVKKEYTKWIQCLFCNKWGVYHLIKKDMGIEGMLVL